MAEAGSVGAETSTGINRWKWQTRDLVVAAALAVPLGIIWSYGWGIVWLAGRGILPQLGLFLDGFYVVAGVLVAYVLRRPGAALVGEMLAALIEIPFTSFGAIVLWLGFLQGIGVELVFLATGYRRFSLPIMLLAGAAGSLGIFIGYDYVAYGYSQLALAVQGANLVVKLLGGALLAGLAGKLIGDALARTGVLNNFPIAQARRQEI